MPRGAYHQYRYRAREKARQATVVTQSIEAIRAQNDFPFFCEYLTRNSPEPKVQPPHMQLWNEYLITGNDSEALLGIAGQNIDILSPRGSAKSTYLGMFVAWAIGNHAKRKRLLQILYISYTVDVARPKSAAIKAIIESKEYREIFPMVLPGSKWGDEYWQIDYDYAGISTLGQEAFTVCCAGLKGAIVSKRSHLVILDDLIKSEKDIENPDIREEMRNNWTRSIQPTMFDGGRAICLGTRFSGNDIHCTTFNQGRWKQIEQSAIVTDEDGEETSYWNFWSLEHLQGLRDDDPVGFSFQYQNRVVRVTETSIDPAWITRGDVPFQAEQASQYDALAIGIDLSSSLKERADYTVFTLVGRKGNNYYVLDGRRFRATGNIEKFDTLIEMWEDWGCPYVRVLVESVAYQLSFAGDFRTYVIEQEDIHEMSCTPVPVKGDKLQRLRGVTGLFENGLVTFNQYRKLGMWVEELTNFGSAAHDDTVDSLCIALTGLVSRGRLEAG